MHTRIMRRPVRTPTMTINDHDLDATGSWKRIVRIISLRSSLKLFLMKYIAIGVWTLSILLGYFRWSYLIWSSRGPFATYHRSGSLESHVQTRREAAGEVRAGFWIVGSPDGLCAITSGYSRPRTISVRDRLQILLNLCISIFLHQIYTQLLSGCSRCHSCLRYHSVSVE